MRKAGWLTPLFLLALAAAAQQKSSRQEKPCIQDPGCGIVVSFNPPFRVDEGILLVPTEVTVDVPLELQPTRVGVQTYPLGTEVADGPYEVLAEISRFQKAGKYARFRGLIEKCPKEEEGGIEVYVLRKKFKQYPLRPWGGAIECREIEAKSTR